MDNPTIHTLLDTIPTTIAAASMEDCCLLTIQQLDLAKLTQTATLSALKLAQTLHFPSLQAPNVSLLVTIMEVLRRDPKNNNMVAVLLNAEEVILANHMVVTDNNTVVMDNNLTAMVITKSNTTPATAAVNRLPLAPAVTSQHLFLSPFLVEYYLNATHPLIVSINAKS